jgi:Mn-dependent DtxR family transcriptional regulator
MTQKLPLTDREEDILAYIYGYIDDNKFSPTRQEIADKFKMARPGADYFVNQLAEKGKIKITPNKWRNIKIKE